MGRLLSGLSAAIDHAIATIREEAGLERGGLALADVPSAGALSEAPEGGRLAMARRASAERAT